LPRSQTMELQRASIRRRKSVRRFAGTLKLPARIIYQTIFRRYVIAPRVRITNGRVRGRKKHVLRRMRWSCATRPGILQPLRQADRGFRSGPAAAPQPRARTMFICWASSGWPFPHSTLWEAWFSIFWPTLYSRTCTRWARRPRLQPASCVRC